MPGSSAVRVCDATGKVMHPSRERAEARIWEVRRGGRDKARSNPFVAYVCADCAHYHIGHHRDARAVPGTLGAAMLAAGVRRGRHAPSPSSHKTEYPSKDTAT